MDIKGSKVTDHLYRLKPPHSELEPFVRRLLVADCDIVDELKIRPGPTGYNYLGWYCSGEAQIVVGGESQSCTGLHFSGQIQGQEIEVGYERTHLTHILAEFTATGLARLTGVLGDDIRGATVPVATLDPSLERRLAEGLNECGSSEVERIDAFQRVLGTLVPTAHPPIDYVEAAARMIESSDGQVSIADVARELDVSQRHLSRRFKKVVGVGPKYFAKVIQLNTALAALLANDYSYLATLSQKCGYYDQAHFVHVMHEFFGSDPTAFLNGRDDVLTTFLGRFR